jgi:predicted MFS family arabinose efflux permease
VSTVLRPRSDRTLTVVLVAVTSIIGVISSLGAPLIPSVARTMHVSLDDAQWSLTVTLLMACVASPIMGRLSDGPHRRAVILTGLAIVFVGSVIAGLAQSLAVLVAGRAMQGIGMGLAPVAMAAAKDHLTPQRSPGVIAILSVSGAAAVGAGYPISGLIDNEFGLHAAFLFGAVLSAGALVAAAMVIPSSRARSHHRLDYVGAIVLTLALVALVLAISEGETWGWGSARTVGLFVVAIAALSIWVPQQLHHPWPLASLRLLRHRSVMTANLAGIILGVALYMYVSLVTELVQQPASLGYGLGASSLVAGCILLPFSIVSIAVSRTLGRVRQRLSDSAILVIGSLLIAAGGAFFALVHTAVWDAFVAMAVIGSGFGYTFAALPGMITRSIPDTEVGSAMGLYQVIRYIGFALGSALAAAIVASHTIDHGTHVLESGFVTGLWIAAGICTAAALISWLLSRRPEATDPNAIDDAQRELLEHQDAELAAAALTVDFDSQR